MNNSTVDISIEKLLDNEILYPNSGFITDVTVVDIINDYCIVDYNGKATVAIDLSDLKDIQDVCVGTKFEVYVSKIDDCNGNIVLSHKDVNKVKALNSIKNAFQNNTILPCVIKDKIPGGLLGEINGFVVFLPVSLIEINDVEDLSQYIGKTLDVMVVKTNRVNNVIVSHRAVLEKKIKIEKQELIKQFSPNQIVEGVVTNITKYGAFVNLGDINGLLHITDMSWVKVNNPNDIVKINDKIKVVVLAIEGENIKLGMKQLTENPWKKLQDENIPIGTIMTCKIISIVDYGIFVSLRYGIDGFVHSSEFLWGDNIPFSMIKPYYHVNDNVTVKLLNINYEDKKITFSIKQVSDNPFNDERILADMAVGTKHKVKIIGLERNVAWIKTDNNICGTLHNTDISWTDNNVNITKLYNVNDVIEVQVVAFDRDSMKISFGVKQLTENPWEKYTNEFAIKSEHEGEVIKKIGEKGYKVRFEHGIEGFCSAEYIPKNETITLHNKYKFITVEFDQENCVLKVIHSKFTNYNFNRNKSKRGNVLADVIFGDKI